MNDILQVLLANLPLILILLAVFLFWKWQEYTLQSALKWLAGMLTEPDGNGGKASASRVIGLYVAWNIVQQSWLSGHEIPGILWDLFMVTLGYALLSKALNSFSPAVIDFARGYRLKMEARKEPST